MGERGEGLQKVYGERMGMFWCGEKMYEGMEEVVVLVEEMEEEWQLVD